MKGVGYHYQQEEETRPDSTPEAPLGEDRSITTQRPGSAKGNAMQSLSKRLGFLIALLVGIAPWVFAQADRNLSPKLLAYSVGKHHSNVAKLPAISVSDLPSEARQTLV